MNSTRDDVGLSGQSVSDAHIGTKRAPAKPGPLGQWVSQLDVAVEHELPGMWPERDRVDFLLALVADPGLDHVCGEHIAVEQELVVALERVQ